MKKLSILLLVVALAGGMAFGADLAVTGDASVSLVYDIDAPSVDVGNATSVSTDFTLNLSSGSASSEGEGDLYATIAGSASLDIDDTGVLGTSISIDSATIEAGDVSVDILGSPDGFSNAISFLDKDSDDALDDDVAAAFGDGEGVTVSTGGMTIGLDYSTVDAWAVSAQADVEVADGVTVAAGVAYDGDIAATAATSLTAGDAVVDLAFDMDMTGGFAYDASAGVALDALAIDVYWGTMLDAQAVASIDAFDVTVSAGDILGALALGLDVTTVVDAATINLGGGYTINTGDYDAYGDVSFAADSATFGVGAVYVSAVAGTTLNLDASITSTTIIDNATVSLVYDSGDILTNVLGTVTGTVTVAL